MLNTTHTFAKFLFVLLGVLLQTSCLTPNKPLVVHPLFTDHMVMQRETEITIWGTGSPHEIIRTKADWSEEIRTNADAGGNWSATLKTPGAGGPYTVTISSGEDIITLEDVMVGEVWLASGQSNMEMPLMGWPPKDTILNSGDEIKTAANSNIRMFTVQRNLALEELTDVKGEWLVSNPETAKNFSASAYFFAKRLENTLNIPIGIIHSSWGGTPAEAWTSKESLEGLGDFNSALASLADPQMEEIKNNWYARWESVDIPNKETDWLVLNLKDQELSNPMYDHSQWEQVELPGSIDKRESWRMDGVIWLRKTFALETKPEEDFLLSLGAVDDMDYTFINGKEIAQTVGAGKHTVQRNYVVPKALLKKGENTIAIRVIDTGGGGGLSDVITLSNKSVTLDLSGTWALLPTAEIHQGKFYMYNLSEAPVLQRPNITDINSHTPGVLYNAMIAPLIPYTIKGAIWYQGESNVGRADQYERLFPTMIKDWRTHWQADFPFYFVQIAPFNYGNNLSAALRDAQRKTLTLKNTGMVVTLDIGNPLNIHPANKKDVGERLAGLALKNDYHQDLIASGPLYKDHSLDGNKVLVSFSNAGSGLMITNTSASGFEIAGDDKVFKEARITVHENQVELMSPEVSTPKYVRYAWKDTSEATLFNKEGFPASSFSIE